MKHSPALSRRSPLGKARGRGSAHDGAHHWITQRVSAIAMLILVPWLMFAIITLYGAAQADAALFLKHPFHALMAIFTVLVMFYHGSLGLQVVIEDYVTCKVKKTLLLIGIKLGCLAAACVGVFSVLSIYFKG